MRSLGNGCPAWVLNMSCHLPGHTAFPDTWYSGIVAPSTRPTITSSRGSHSLWEDTTGALVEEAGRVQDREWRVSIITCIWVCHLTPHTHCVHDCTSRSRGGAQGADSDGTTEGSIARRCVDETAMHCGTEEHRVESIQAGQRGGVAQRKSCKNEEKNLWLVRGEKTKGMWDATTIPASTTTEGVGRGEDTNNTGGVRWRGGVGEEQTIGHCCSSWITAKLAFCSCIDHHSRAHHVMCCHKCRTCKNWIRTHLERHFS